MNTSRILADLRAERDRIASAIAALESLNGRRPLGGDHGGPSPSSLAATILAPTKPGRNISTEGRARIAAAAKARRAKQKAAKPTGPGRNISAAGRKRIAEAARKMWAEPKKDARTAAKTVAPEAIAGARQVNPEARQRTAKAMKERSAERKSEAATVSRTDADDSLHPGTAAESLPVLPSNDAVRMDTTNHELQERYQTVIAQATARMESAPTVKTREKWRLVRETWEKLLQKEQGTQPDV